MSGKAIPAFHVMSRAWYASASAKATGDDSDQISIGRYCVEGGCEFEFTIKWHSLGRNMAPCSPRVGMFSDSWAAFADPAFTQLFSVLAKEHGNDLTVDEMTALLLSLGFVDKTAYESPYKSVEPDSKDPRDAEILALRAALAAREPA